MESSEIEKIDVDQLTKNLKIDDQAAFTSYLKEIWNDLYSRVTENKNDEKDKDKDKEKTKEVNVKGISKLVFDKYFTLPGIIGDRFFRVLDVKECSVLSLNDFVKGMKTIFCGDYEETLRFVFDFYDLDRDGLIDKEDIRVVLSYITLAESPDVKSTGVNLSYKNRVTSQEELYKILQQCFEKNNKMNFANFKKVIENVNSDLYLMIYLFLLENKPFSKENIKPYQTSDKKGKESPSPKSPKGKLIASPSKNTNFSPYHQFNRKVRRRRTTVVVKDVDYSKIIQLQGEKKAPPKKEDVSYKRKGRKRKTVQYEANIITLGSLQEGEKKIDEDRVKDLTRKPKKKLSSDIKEEEVQIKPAFKQKIGTKKLDSDKKVDKEQENSDKNKEREEDKEFDENDFDLDDSDSSSEDESKENEEEEKEEDILKYEGLLYKFVDNKMRKLYFKLVHKDLYFYKNKEDKMHKGMHNLNGLFLQEEKPKNYNGVLFYSFSVVYPSKTRVYYCNNEKEYKTWISKLKIATGYTNLLDIYTVKHKLGKGKFGLVKLGENKITHQEVAIKIMNKKNMDSSDLELVRTEIEILKICQHPNIIRLYDVFENPDYIYIIMEYCKGGDLFGYLETRGFRIPEDRASKIMHKMCAAVYYMHSYGIAHRDLKPENVLMTSLEDDSDIRILDFGLSKIVGPYEKCDEPYGTLTYCAPEIILDEPYSKAVDLWSLGIMTYLMLSGRLPFNSEDENEIARQVAYDDPDFTRNPIWSMISSDAKDFVKRLLTKDPFQRMKIKQALEHKFITNYDSENITVKRNDSNDGSKNFEFYSSTTKIDK